MNFKILTIISLLFSHVGFCQVIDEKADSLESNQIVFDSLAHQLVLKGYLDRDSLVHFSEFSDDYQFEYQNYTPNIDSLFPDKSILQEYQIIIVLGTWCSDSRREVPRFLKLADSLQIPPQNIVFIGVDWSKSARVKNLNHLNIQLVPTFILLQNGNEIGRIVETPSVSLEHDLNKILEHEQ
ncbi:MAG: thioredoxin family protein [Bacteroidales bacterium]|nr:thioredoxin family protein [Bacteroidales bacterium]